MTRLACDLDEGGELAVLPGGDGGLPGYDEWRLATPREYEARYEAPPSRVGLLPADACGRRSWPWLCTLPAGHSRDGGKCNTEGRAR